MNYSPCESLGTCYEDMKLLSSYNRTSETRITTRSVSRQQWYSMGNTAFVNQFASFSYTTVGAFCALGASMGNPIPCAFSLVFGFATFMMQQEAQRISANGAEVVYPNSQGQFNDIETMTKRNVYTDPSGNVYDLIWYNPDKRDSLSYTRGNILLQTIGYLQSDVVWITTKMTGLRTADFVHHFISYAPNEDHLGHLNKRMSGKPEAFEFVYEYNVNNVAVSDMTKGDDAIGNEAEQMAEMWNSEENNDKTHLCQAVYSDNGKLYNKRTILTKDGIFHSGELDSYKNNGQQWKSSSYM
ncbi:hypothetical protein E3Q19_03494 [Wallemia mellicola]|nr:hypothetical protein E3Q19_03494 [Wallemia mellicola]TIC25390.1 hypothetical protein E3Q11_03378 [Wallemia mellicola]TIC72997.1 hypothetical protein E3Q00_03383 [Wallemia mellicola]